MTEKRLILIVDDDAMIRMVVKNMLSKQGYAVVEAADGNEALDKYLESKPALVLCDRMMPGMSGYAFAQKLRALGEKTPVVFLTSLNDPRDKLAVADIHVSGYLEKPITADTLAACLQGILGSAGGND